MKKNVVYLWMLICSMSLFTACSNDDSNTPNDPPIDTELAGTYKGALDVVVDNNELAKGLPKNISITKAGASSVTMELKDFSFMKIEFGTITIPNCAVKQEKEGYSFAGTHTLKLNAPIGECPVVVNGTIVSGKITALLDIDVPVMNQKVKVTYKGAKLSGSESGEAKISNFTIESSVITESPVIDEATGKITFKVNEAATDEELKLTPVFTISGKATVSPASGVVQNFSKGNKVVYTVVAEDGTQKVYQVSIKGMNQLLVYDFETWVKGVQEQDPENTFYEVEGWSSSNTGAHLLKVIYGLADRYVVTQTKDARSGESAARIETIDTKGGNMGVIMPKVTTGTLFLGAFISDMENLLNSTKFGIPYDRKPLTLTGFYKYVPGDIYYRYTPAATSHEVEVDPTAKDECAINVVLYETTAYDDIFWKDCLTGVADPEENIYTSSRIAAIGSFVSGEQKDWKGFTVQLEYKKEFNPASKYRMAIVCSSSKDGDKFCGAPGSVLTVDDFKLMAE